jgi:hypothetical protein
VKIDIDGPLKYLRIWRVIDEYPYTGHLKISKIIQIPSICS